jgi:23S rRNA (guanosine2251-2'-O)-methyltransferase
MASWSLKVFVSNSCQAKDCNEKNGVLSMELLEGRISVEAALLARKRRFQMVGLREGLHDETIPLICQEAGKQNIPIKWLPADEIDRMAHGKSHGGVVALCSAKREPDFEEFYDRFKFVFAPLLLLLEGVDDERNFGITLRSAEAMGVYAVLLKKHLWDFDSAAVSRASSGAFERMPIILFEEVDRVIVRLQRHGLRLYGCIANAQKSMYEVNLAEGIILAIGGEKRGLSAAVRNHCDKLIKIPMQADIGSLSLSHAAAILMAEAMRQRRQNPVEQVDP